MEMIINEKPTRKQISYAKDIANRLKIRLPRELTKQAYSQFISDNVNAFKKTKAEQRHYLGIDEDDGWAYGSCLEDIM